MGSSAAVGSIVALALSACAPVQTAADSPQLAAPIEQEAPPAVLLVATTNMADPRYRHTVLLAIPLDADRHIGFIINRPSPRSLASLFPKHRPSAKVVEPVYVGGPAARTALIAAVKTYNDPGEGSMKLMHGLYMAIKTTAVDHIIETTPNEARYYLGHVRWRPGELRSELHRRLWYVTEPDLSVVFRRDTRALWREMIERAHSMRAGLKGDGAHSAEVALMAPPYHQ